MIKPCGLHYFTVSLIAIAVQLLRKLKLYLHYEAHHKTSGALMC